MVQEAKTFFWDFGSLITAQCLALVLSMVYTAIIARSLGPHNYGLAGIFLSIVQFVFCICVNWSGTAVLRFGKEELHNKHSMSSTFWARMVIMSALLLLAFIVLFFMQRRLNDYLQVTSAALWLIIPLIVGYSFFDFCSWILRTTNSMKQYALVLLLRQIVLLLLTCSFIFFTARLTLPMVISIEAITYLTLIAVTFLFLQKNIFLPFIIDSAKIKEILVYSWPLFISLFSGFIVEWIDLYFIKYFFGFKETGIYQSAYRLFFYLSTITTSLSTVLFPIIISASINKKDKLIKDFYIGRFTAQIAFGWNILVSILLIASNYVFIAFFGIEYSQAIFPFKIICIGAAAQIITSSYSSVLCSFTNLRKLAFVNLAAAVIKLFLNLILVPLFNISGAALSTATTMFFSVFAYMILTQRHYKMFDFRAPFFLLLPIVLLFFTCLNAKIYYHILFFMAAVAIFSCFAKSLRIFSKADISLLEKIEMPVFLRNTIRQVYAAFS